MGRIVVTQNVSLDGVVQDPTGEEGFRHGGWFAQVGENDRDERAKRLPPFEIPRGTTPRS